MFKIIDVQQGTDEWLHSRMGKPTASVFDKIITKTGKLSASSEEIINRAVAELIMGEPDETFQSDAMARGNALESDALDFFNFTYGYEFKAVGFCEALDATGNPLEFGCSPDALDEDQRIGLELKCPLAHTHLAYLAAGKLPNKYYQQVQGSMLVTGYDKWIFGSYHPSFKGLHVVVERDEDYIEKMKEHILYCAETIKARQILLADALI